MAKEPIKTVEEKKTDVPQVKEEKGKATQVIMPDPVVSNDKPIRSFEVPPATPNTIREEGQPTQVIL